MWSVFFISSPLISVYHQTNSSLYLTPVFVLLLGSVYMLVHSSLSPPFHSPLSSFSTFLIQSFYSLISTLLSSLSFCNLLPPFISLHSPPSPHSPFSILHFPTRHKARCTIQVFSKSQVVVTHITTTITK